MQEPTEKLSLLFTRCEGDTFHFLLNVTYVHMLLITGCEGDISVLVFYVARLTHVTCFIHILYVSTYARTWWTTCVTFRGSIHSVCIA